MSKNKNIYGWWMPWHELVGIPLLIYFVGKRKIIKTLLSEKIAKAQINAEKIGELTIKEREKKLIEYERLDHFFSYHFKDME